MASSLAVTRVSSAAIRSHARQHIQRPQGDVAGIADGGGGDIKARRQLAVKSPRCCGLPASRRSVDGRDSRRVQELLMPSAVHSAVSFIRPPLCHCRRWPR